MSQETYALAAFDGFERVREFIVARGPGNPPLHRLRRMPNSVPGNAHGRERVASPKTVHPPDALDVLNDGRPGTELEPYAWVEANAFEQVHGYDQPPRGYALTEAAVAEYGGNVVAAFAIFDAPNDPTSDTHAAWFYAAFPTNTAEGDIDLGLCTFTDVSGELLKGPAERVNIAAFERLVASRFTQRYSRWQRVETIRLVDKAPPAWF